MTFKERLENNKQQCAEQWRVYKEEMLGLTFFVMGVLALEVFGAYQILVLHNHVLTQDMPHNLTDILTLMSAIVAGFIFILAIAFSGAALVENYGDAIVAKFNQYVVGNLDNAMIYLCAFYKTVTKKEKS